MDQVRYSTCTNSSSEPIELSAREVFIFWTLVEREERGASEERSSYMA